MKRLIALLVLLGATAVYANPVPPPGLRKVTTDSSLTGTGWASSPLGLLHCITDGDTLIWDAGTSTWGCGAGGGGSGTVTNVDTLAPLQGGPITTTGTVSLSLCAALQVLKMNGGGTAWGCAAGGISNGAGANVVMKSDGTNAVGSTITDDGSTVTIGAAVDVSSHQIHNVTDGSSAQDAVTLTQLKARAANVPMATASTSGVITDISFDYPNVRGVWWSSASNVSLDGFGYTTGSPSDGDRFLLCMSGGGILTAIHQAGGGTAGHKFMFAGSQNQTINSLVCRWVIYASSDTSWHLDAQPITTQIANTLLKSGGTGVPSASSISDNGTTVSTTEAVSTGALTSTTLHATGAATLDSTLGVTGAATLSSTAHVVGGATLDSTLSIGGALTATGTTAQFGTSSTTVHITDKDTTARPTLSSCGTSPSLVGNDASGRITVGTGGSSSCTVTWNTAYSANYGCQLQSHSGGSFTSLTYATGSLVMTKALNAGEVIDYQCRDH